ncbi:ATP-dependent RNA helicase ddx54-like [Plakobranchus ocellatus]|uniref:ATP-dependent RNA helicase ddx54-like n=1 Tax=Plakobranchus ocellatus TaxID=259542 RepID=A0AAV4CDY9_9GAST|nr:ATP-dependent RNA helicase ddx54-like [Plakobranchus ocellatus]
MKHLYSALYRLSINGNFEREAASAVLDFTNMDDEPDNKKKRKWDRKRKKYVTETVQDPKKKKIKTESGNWIQASYKSSAYPYLCFIYLDWRNRTKIAEQEEAMNDGEDSDGEGRGGSRGRTNNKPHRQNSIAGTGKFTVAGMNNRRWHRKGMENPMGQASKQKFKRGGKNAMGLKSSEQILKSRRHKAKVQNFQKYREGVRAKRKGKDHGGGGGGAKRRGGGGGKKGPGGKKR